MQKNMQAFRVRRCFSMQGEKCCRGQDLFSPLQYIDDALLMTEQGRICYIGKYSQKHIPSGVSVLDLGEKTLVPKVVNAHTHLQLSHVSSRTIWHKGFVTWLKSLIALLPEPLNADDIDKALQDMAVSGTGFFADYTNTGIDLIIENSAKYLNDTNGFCFEGLFLAEWFGFIEQWNRPLPLRVQNKLGNIEQEIQERIIPCSHALYSTAPQILQRNKAWCNEFKHTFTLHLSESEEEIEALLLGSGALIDLYKSVVLPKDWQAPLLRPIEFAQTLGLLDDRTMAIHCVHCSERDLKILDESRCFVCLCPRSNYFLGTGTAPFWNLAKLKVALCLGTDGLSSNIDVNVWNEALYLRDTLDVPLYALLRMLTVNGACALNVDRYNIKYSGSLSLGKIASWTFLPDKFELK